MDKIQFIIYNKQSHFKQSNVGISLENGELGGITNIMGDKVFIYFDGNHEHFDMQIKQGIARVLINQQVYGSNWRQVIKNSALLSLPEWYESGLTSYISKGWNSEIENSVRDGILSNKYRRFNRLSDNDAVIAGHSLWAYIAETYGESVIPNILYMTRVTQSVEKGFLYVLGIPMKSLTTEWLNYYKTEYKLLKPTEKDAYLADELFKIRKHRAYSQFKVSEDGNNYAFVTNQLGQYKIYIYYKDSDKSYKIFKKEFKLDRINDNSYPILAWHPSGELLAFITEEKGMLKLYNFNVNTGGLEVKALFQLEKVVSMDFSDSGQEMVFSGVNKGQSDLYLYNIGSNSHKKITNDLFDDLDAKFIDNSTKIIFTSNRTNDSLGYQPKNLELFQNKRDVWTIDYLSPEKKLFSVTKTPAYSEKNPYGAKGKLYYLGEENKINTRFSAVKDSFITHIDTVVHYHHFYEVTPAQKNYSRGIIEQTITKSEKNTEIIVDNYKFHLLNNNLNKSFKTLLLNDSTKIDSTTTSSNEIYKPQENIILLKNVEIKKSTIDSTSSIIDTKNYVFDNEKTTPIQRNTIVVSPTKSTKIDTIPEEFKLPNQRNYNLSFFNDNSGIKLSNSFVNGEYQLFTGGPFNSPGLGAVVKIGTVDLFEDYKVFGGVRISSGTREYFMTFQDYLKRWDKEYTFARTSFSASNGFDVFGVTTNTLHYSLKYPFSEVASVRGTASLRNDNIVTKSVDQFALDQPDINELRGIIKLAYVFDNSRYRMPNIYYGTKFKLFGEYYQEAFNGDAGDRVRGNTQVYGLDFRHSLKISREIVWVNRVASSVSLGNERVVYYLGSVDEWLPIGGTDRFINQEDIDFTKNYHYQALAANLRGFAQNIRRGSNFAVFNSELRVPVFKYFIRRPIRSKFVENFQFIGFADVGSAWDGLDPWDKDNRVNKEVIVDGPLTVTVFKNADPIVAGYGFGIRSTLLGYFVRADWAWGVEDEVSKKRPIFYLSFSFDI